MKAENKTLTSFWSPRRLHLVDSLPKGGWFSSRYFGQNIRYECHMSLLLTGTVTAIMIHVGNISWHQSQERFRLCHNHPCDRLRVACCWFVFVSKLFNSENHGWEPIYTIDAKRRDQDPIRNIECLSKNVFPWLTVLVLGSGNYLWSVTQYETGCPSFLITSSNRLEIEPADGRRGDAGELRSIFDCQRDRDGWDSGIHHYHFLNSSDEVRLTTFGLPITCFSWKIDEVSPDNFPRVLLMSAQSWR
jgi:hypothetical protein